MTSWLVGTPPPNVVMPSAVRTGVVLHGRVRATIRMTGRSRVINRPLFATTFAETGGIRIRRQHVDNQHGHGHQGSGGGVTSFRWGARSDLFFFLVVRFDRGKLAGTRIRRARFIPSFAEAGY